MQHKAHVIGAKQRTDDIRTTEEVSFSALLLSDVVLDGLKLAGFLQPSPIQLKAIPLGKCGLDLVVQAKSGTGKTCVLAVVALEQLLTGSAISGQRCQTLVLAPTREVAVQIASVVTAVGAEIKGLIVQMFIGGTPLAQDIAHCKRCHVAVGTPGRVKHLIESGHLKTDSVRLFVMDEADKLMDSSFVDDINYIYTALPTTKQMLALSATYPEALAALLARYMRSPTFVRLSKSNQSLLGIGQYVMSVDQHGLAQRQIQLKMTALRQLLSNIDFTQCLVFSNYQTRAETISGELERAGWPTAHISAALSQQQRLAAVVRLTALKCRVMVSTDLAARGLDCQHVDLIVHLEVARDAATFLHRAGRAGRYGSLGAAVTLAARGAEAEQLVRVARAAGVTLRALPEQLPARLELKLEDPHKYQLFGGGDAELLVDSCDPTPQPSVDLSPPDASSERPVPATSAGDGGRRVLKARRRATSSADVKPNGHDGERMEAATDGWFSAVAGGRRNNRPPLTPNEATLFPKTSKVSPKSSKVSPKTSKVSPKTSKVSMKTSKVSPKMSSLAGGGDTDGVGRTAASQDRADSPDSDDSFATSLRAYRLEQERRLQDDQNCSMESSDCVSKAVESDQSAVSVNSSCSPSAIDWSLVQSALAKLHPAVKDAVEMSAEELTAVGGYMKCVLSGEHMAMYNKLIGQVDAFGASKVFRSIFNNESNRLDLEFIKSKLTEGMQKLSVGGSDVDVAQGNTGRVQKKVTVPGKRSPVVTESSEVHVHQSAGGKNGRQVVADPADDEVQRLETNEDDLLTFQVELRRRVALREQELLLARTAGPVAGDQQDDSSSCSSDSDGETQSAGRSGVQPTCAAPADGTGHVQWQPVHPETSSGYGNYPGYPPVHQQTSSGYGNCPGYPPVHPHTSGYGNHPGYPPVHQQTSSGYGNLPGYPPVHPETYTGYPPTHFSHDWYQHPVDYSMYPGYYPLHQHPPGRQWRLQQQLLQCYHEQTSYLSHMTAFCQQ